MSGFTSKVDAISEMNNTIQNDFDPRLTPLGVDHKIKSGNLKAWLTKFLDWITPTQTGSLKGKSPMITTDNQDYASLSWVNIIPVGTVLPWGGKDNINTPPDGFLFCDGSAYEPNDYPELYSVIGTAYGSFQSSFKVPNLDGKTIFGRLQAQGTPFDYVGRTGGNSTATLTVNNLPPHFHSAGGYQTASGGTHNHEVNKRKFAVNTATGTEGFTPPENGSFITGGSHTHTIIGNSGSTGSGSSFNILPPFVTMRYIIKT